MTEQHDCAEQIFRGTSDRTGSWGYCSRNGKIERDGKWWCKQHDPDEVVRRRAERAAHDRAEFTARTEQIYRRRVEEDACKDLSTTLLESLPAGHLARLIEREGIHHDGL